GWGRTVGGAGGVSDGVAEFWCGVVRLGAGGPLGVVRLLRGAGAVGPQVAAHPFQRGRDLAAPGVEVVATTVEDDRRDAGGRFGLLDEAQRLLVVVLAHLAAG